MNILVAADFAPQNRIETLISKGDYHFFDEIRNWTKQANYSIVNLEAPLSEKNCRNRIKKTGPSLCAPKRTIESIHYAGFNAVSLANNHFRDYGQKGIDETIKACQDEEIDYVGGGRDLEECERILYKDIDAKSLAIINVCENEWSIATKDHGGSNPLNPIKQYYDIQKAKREVQYVIVIVHGGTEWYNLPTPRMKETYRFFIDAGADAIINHHQHCYSGYEVYKGKPIFYGLGNFCFDKKNTQQPFWYDGYMVMLSFNEIVNFKLIPYTQCHEEAQIQILEDRNKFDKSIKALNSIIDDDQLLQTKFHEKAMQRESTIKNILEPFNNRIFASLRSRRWIPSLVNKNKLINLLSHTQCEAHRDLMNEYLKSKLK